MRFRRWVCIASLAALAVAMWFGTSVVIRRSYSGRIPSLPDLSIEAPPVVEQLRLAHRDALRRPTSAQAVGRLAMTLHANTFSREALTCYELANALDPEDGRWNYYRILLHQETGEAGQAAALLSELVRAQEHHALAWFKLGEASLDQGRVEDAAHAFRRCRDTAGTMQTQLDPRPPVYPIEAFAALGLARIAFQQERFEDVVQVLAPVTERWPRFGPAQRMLGRAYQRLNRDGEAARAIALASDCAPYTPPVDPMVDRLALLSRSTTFLLRCASQARIEGDATWADRLLRQGLELYPNDADLLGERVFLLCSTSRLEEAEALIDRYLSLKPANAATPIRIGASLSSQGVHEPAIKCFRYAVSIAPHNQGAHMNLGAALASSGEFGQAVQSFRRALEIEPRSFQTRFNLVKALFAAERHDQVIVEAVEALKIEPGDVETRMRLAAALDRSGKLDEAIAQYRAVLEQAPDHVLTLDSLALALSRSGAHEEALAVAERLIQAADPLAQAHFTVARVAATAGKRDLAREHCRIALQRDPDHAPAKELLEQLK
jgi:tetratricopeptide (TPR) repeat protein